MFTNVDSVLWIFNFIRNRLLAIEQREAGRVEAINDSIAKQMEAREKAQAERERAATAAAKLAELTV